MYVSCHLGTLRTTLDIMQHIFNSLGSGSSIPCFLCLCTPPVAMSIPSLPASFLIQISIALAQLHHSFLCKQVSSGRLVARRTVAKNCMPLSLCYSAAKICWKSSGRAWTHQGVVVPTKAVIVSKSQVNSLWYTILNTETGYWSCMPQSKIKHTQNL